MASWLGEPFVDEYNGLNLHELPLNYAFVIANTSLKNAGVYSVRDDCNNCPFSLQQRLQPGVEAIWQVDTSVQRTWRIMRNNQQQYLARNYRRGLLCDMRPGMGEYAVYRLDIGRCGMNAEVPPANSYLPLMMCASAFLSIFIMYAFVQCILSCKQKVVAIKTGQPLLVTDEKPKGEHLESLYVLRGLIISMIIFVGSGGGGYPLFTNLRGELTLNDWIVFIYSWTVGFHIPTAVSEEEARGLNKRKILIGAVVRSCILVIIGSVMSAMSYIPGYKLTHGETWCPLQRLGIAYIIAASMYLLTVKKFDFKSKKTFSKIISNVVTLKWCWVLSGMCFAVITILILTAVSMNCQGNPNVESAQLEFSNDITEVIQNCNNNLTTIFNTILFADDRTVPYVNGYYGFSAGFMGVLTTCMVAMMGLKAGTVYLHHEQHKIRLRLWAFWATIFFISAIIIAGLWFPLRINLWPVATILIISSLAQFFYIFVYISTEKKQRSVSMLTSTGAASFILYASYLFFSNSIPFQWEKKFHNHLFYLAQNIGFIFLWIMIAVILRRKNIRILI